MLTPEYLAGCAAQVEELYAALNEQITADICRRIVKTGVVTDTAAWQAKQLQESGKLYDDIVSDVAKSTGKNESEIKKMFAEAGVTSIKNDVAPLRASGISLSNGLSDPMKNVLEANMRKTNGDMLNLAMTTASNGQQEFVNAMNEAIMKVQSGAFDYQTAIRQAVNDCARIGAKVSYDTGAQMALESAARMNILTAVNQTAAKITEMNAERMGCEYYETSAHAGARLEHQEWQGKVFKIEGADGDYENFYDATGYGEVTGLCGVNCRHSFFPFWPGISKPAYSEETLERYSEKTVEWHGVKYTEYEASQIMRRYERSVRDSKRIMNGYKEAIKVSESEELTAELNNGLQQAKQTYNARRYRLLDFCKETGFKRDYLRTKTGLTGFEGFDQGLVKLTYDEAAALSKYVSSDFYAINAKIRTGMPLTGIEQGLVESLDSALKKFPKYDGAVSRSLYFTNSEDLAAFLEKHKVRNTVTYSDFTSCTASKELYNASGQVQMYWKSSNGRNITVINDAEKEVLYERNFSFRVEAVEKVSDSLYNIFISEVTQ